MISVIEDNRPRYKVTCPRCNSVLEYMNEDVHKDWTGKIRQGYDILTMANVTQEEYIDYIICPLCKNVVIVQKVWRDL